MAIRTQCNLCGKMFDAFDERHDIKIVRRMGYGSMYDGDDIELDLCCECIDSLIEKCEISPIIPMEKCEKNHLNHAIRQYLRTGVKPGKLVVKEPRVDLALRKDDRTN